MEKEVKEGLQREDSSKRADRGETGGQRSEDSDRKRAERARHLGEWKEARESGRQRSVVDGPKDGPPLSQKRTVGEALAELERVRKRQRSDAPVRQEDQWRMGEQKRSSQSQVERSRAHPSDTFATARHGYISREQVVRDRQNPTNQKNHDARDVEHRQPSNPRAPPHASNQGTGGRGSAAQRPHSHPSGLSKPPSFLDSILSNVASVSKAQVIGDRCNDEDTKNTFAASRTSSRK